MRPGVRLAIDVGTVRVGIARSDPSGLLALPVETVNREVAHARVAELLTEWNPLEIIVGLPLSLAGRDTPSTTDAREFAATLAESQSVPVRVVDERLTTVSAQQALRDTGHSAKSSRSRIDQAAAVILLQHCLDGERSTGHPPGQVV